MNYLVSGLRMPIMSIDEGEWGKRGFAKGERRKEEPSRTESGMFVGSE